MHYYPRNISDYRRDTNRLTIIQHGAYALLMDEAYDTEKPLPSNPEDLYQICRARSKDERLAISFVVEKFFAIDGDTLRHKRIDGDVAEYQKGAAQRRRNGKNGGRPKKPNDNQNQTEKEPSRFSVETDSSSISISSSEGKGGAGGRGDWAERIVSAYVRKDSPMDCMASVASAIDAGEEPEVILQSVREIASLCRAAPSGADNQFIPRAKTFFSEGQWRSPEAFRKRWEPKQNDVPRTFRPPSGV